MCGFFGLMQRDGSPISPAFVRHATDLLRHRGPDDEGYLCFHTKTKRTLSCAGRDTDRRLGLPSLDQANKDCFDFALGFRRLSVIDPSPGGHQPMVSHDGRYWIVLNGEIYNYVEIRQELQELGHRFHSASDTEVLLTAYAQWGPQALRRFVGMFAFAVLDTAERVVFLGRDPFGIKPLYYTLNDGAFAFASEIPALLDVPGVRRSVNPERLYLYLTYGLTDHGSETMFADIHQLPAAHYMDLSLEKPGTPNPICYWRIDLGNRLSLSPEDAGERLRDMFLESTRLHLRSDVAIGAALSGGLDSSSIVNAIRHVQGRNAELHTFSYIAGESGIDEEPWVDIAGNNANAIIHKVTLTAEDLLADMDHFTGIQAEPFGSTSIYAQYRVFRLAREAGITVVLDGQGADELLAGYRWHVSVRFASLFSQWRFPAACRLLGNQSLPDAGWKTFFLEAWPFLIPRSMQALRLTARTGVGTPVWLNSGWFTKRGTYSYPYAPPHGSDLFRETLRQGLTTTLPMLLRYEDRNSMSQSVESRVPFLTTALADFLLALPDKLLIDDNGLSKAVLRHAMRGILPEAIVNRQDKIGFVTPERKWLNSLRPWVDQTLTSTIAAEIPAINHQAMRQEWHKLINGSAPFNFTVWRWVNLIRWVDLFKVVIN